MNTAGPLWRWGHGLLTAAFAALLLIAGVLGFQERTRSDSIVEFVGGGYGIDLEPGQVAVIGSTIELRDAVTLESVAPVSSAGDGRIVAVREGPYGGTCIDGWPVRTHYTRRMTGIELKPRRPLGDFIALYFLPTTPRWEIDAVLVQYTRRGVRHEQRFDLSIDIHATQDNRGCPPRPAYHWDAPVDSDAAEVVCINAWQALLTLEAYKEHVAAKDPVFRRAIGTHLRTVATWAPDVEAPNVREAAVPLAATRPPTPANTIGVAAQLEAVVAACRDHGAYSNYPVGLRDPADLVPPG